MLITYHRLPICNMENEMVMNEKKSKKIINFKWDIC